MKVITVEFRDWDTPGVLIKLEELTRLADRYKQGSTDDRLALLGSLADTHGDRASVVFRALDAKQESGMALAGSLVLEDATVPRSRITDMLIACQEIGKKYNLTLGTFGHAGEQTPLLVGDRLLTAHVSDMDRPHIGHDADMRADLAGQSAEPPYAGRRGSEAGPDRGDHRNRGQSGGPALRPFVGADGHRSRQDLHRGHQVRVGDPGCR